MSDEKKKFNSNSFLAQIIHKQIPFQHFLDIKKGGRTGVEKGRGRKANKK